MLIEIYKECPDWLRNAQRLKVIMHIQNIIIIIIIIIIMKLVSTLAGARRAYNKIQYYYNKYGLKFNLRG